MTQKSVHQFLQSNYKYPQQTKQDIANAVKYSKGLIPKVDKLFIFENGQEKELICLDGTIKVMFRESQYNIPVCLYLTEQHPHIAPICYVRPTKDMTIKQSSCVDGSGRIFLPYLSQWNKNTSDLLSLIQFMQIAFGNTPPVFKKASYVESIQQPTRSNISMPALPNSYNPNGESWRPSLPNSAATNNSQHYPFSSPSQTSGQAYINNTATITEEHIRASLQSAVEDKYKLKLKEKIHRLQDEIHVLKKDEIDLHQGKAKLDEIKSRMAMETDQLLEAKQKLTELNDQLQGFITKYEEEGEEVDPDEVYGPTQPLFKQLLDAVAEENAVVDAIYYTGEGLRKGVITLDVFLKNVRELSRRQFMLRALIKACRSKANLPN